MIHIDRTRYLTTKQAAYYISASPRTLEKYRQTGQGPIYYRFGGRVLYAIADIDLWIKASARRSTSDKGSPSF